MDNDVSFRRDIGMMTMGSVMLIIYHLVLAWIVTSNGRICVNNSSQVNYTLSYVLETTV